MRCLTPTRAQVAAAALHGGNAPRDAWADAPTGGMATGDAVPAPSAEGAVAVTLTVALNGQDHHRAPRPWAFHPHLAVAALAPHAGPTRGNTTVTLAVDNLQVLIPPPLPCKCHDMPLPSRR